ncbi:hypothetical protein E4T66_15965 [Sinimarinibacterium sp. CAU 1509]|uniref:hypothetical protein n=1 Tax=Sinimarinibacterium sp. CAU 1509 TaxID=2562283 RepID=UPI0010AC0566|nr:hypothetical protein [Sinimarinibacterium sp. CAU 1509]TJY58192.1 hypothetical protein E4T66_15965 [Sinimarinibacterium sp. CAU 1509]
MHPYHLALRTQSRLTSTKAYADADPIHFREMDTLISLVGVGIGLIPYVNEPDNFALSVFGLCAGAAGGYLGTVLRRLRVRSRRRHLLAPALAEIAAVEEQQPLVLQALALSLGDRINGDPSLRESLSDYAALVQQPERYWAVLKSLLTRLESREARPLAAA